MDDTASKESLENFREKTEMDGNNDQCKFFLIKKGRLCRFRPKPGQHYCPEHACVMGIQDTRKRIPCPLNPKHNCYEDELEKHVKKCNVTKIQQNVQRAAYYVKGVNNGPSCNESSSLTSEQQICVKDLTSEELAKMIKRVEKLYQDHVEPIESNHFQHICVQAEFCTSEKEDLNTVFKDQAALKKELTQQAALVGQLSIEDFLNDENSCFIEMGAGKGKLSQWIHKAIKSGSHKFILVERGSVRYKVDGHLKQDQANFQRIKMDIQDLFLGKVPEIHPDDNTFIVGKHLCGGATDMGLRCAMNTLIFDRLGTTSDSQNILFNTSNKSLTTNDTTDRSNSSCESQCLNNSSQNDISVKSILSPEASLPSVHDGGICDNKCSNKDTTMKMSFFSTSSQETLTEPPKKMLKLEESTENYIRVPKGIMIALCCHHRCTWDTYVGQDFMESCGISPMEFDLLTRLSSWATCARNSAGKANKDSSSSTIVDSSSNNSGKDDLENKDNHYTKDLISLSKNSNQHLRDQLSVPERERIGRLCKRLIDTGRLHYLRSKGMKAFLREYIDEQTTPENVVLFASNQPS